MKPTKTIKRDNEMQQFHIQMWDVSEAKVLARGHDIKEWKQRYRKHYWEGTVEHLQTGESIIFHDIAELLRFIQDRRGAD